MQIIRQRNAGGDSNWIMNNIDLIEFWKAKGTMDANTESDIFFKKYN
jgi:hypothetical protein